MTEEAVLGGGCFWCIEAAFKEVEGVEEVVSGYAGGHTENPTYEEVCDGDTGHAEVVKVEYDTGKISFRQILHIFFKIHNPTTENREGPDEGSQYRSIILYQGQSQKEIVEELIKKKQEDYKDEIVTEVKELEDFYRAEEKHQDYFEKNPNDRYCRIHAQQKVETVKDFQD